MPLRAPKSRLVFAAFKIELIIQIRTHNEFLWTQEIYIQEQYIPISVGKIEYYERPNELKTLNICVLLLVIQNLYPN